MHAAVGVACYYSVVSFARAPICVVSVNSTPGRRDFDRTLGLGCVFFSFLFLNYSQLQNFSATLVWFGFDGGRGQVADKRNDTSRRSEAGK